MSKLIRCDNCSKATYNKGAPYYWYRIFEAENERGDFCSIACLVEWATPRANEEKKMREQYDWNVAPLVVKEAMEDE